MRSLRAQLSLAISMVVLLTVALLSLVSNLTVNRQFEAYVTEQEKVQSETIVAHLGTAYNSLSQDWNPDFLHTVGMYSLYDGYLLKIYDRAGSVLWDAEHHDMTLCGQIMGEISDRMEKTKSAGGFSAHTYEIQSGAKTVGSVSVTYYGPFFYSEGEVKFLHTLNAVLLSVGVFALAASLGAGWLLSRRIARPVVKTAAIARQISAGNYGIRFEGTIKTRELNDLAGAVNYLAEALQEQERLRKRLTADLAHELRTPLAAVGAHLEAMLEGIWEPTPDRLRSCHEEVIRLGKLAADLERLARVEGEDLTLRKAPVDLTCAARTVCAALEPEWKGKNLTLTVEGESVTVPADGDRIAQVITNLLSNAIKYTPEQGHIRVSVTHSEQEGILAVEDDGIGIPEEELPLIFERFYRTDRSRSRSTGGAGIGLAIVRSIVTAHGGTVRAEHRDGKGSRFVVTIPKV